MESVQVRLRLAGRKVYEQPMLLSLSNRFPKVGDLIEIPYDGHAVQAEVTATTSPICRERDLVTYLVYASELEDRKQPASDSEPMPVFSIVGLLALAISRSAFLLAS